MKSSSLSDIEFYGPLFVDQRRQFEQELTQLSMSDVPEWEEARLLMCGTKFPRIIDNVSVCRDRITGSTELHFRDNSTLNKYAIWKCKEVFKKHFC